VQKHWPLKFLEALKMIRADGNGKVKKEVLAISSELISSMGQFLRREGFIELLPVVISSITDPLDHSVFDASIEYYGGKYSLTKSMIFHKQFALRVYPRIFIFSPNIRFEEQSRASTGKHLIEFIQLDLEVINAKRENILELIEKMIVDAFRNLDEKFGKVLRAMNSKFSIPEIPFKRVKYLDAYRMYGNDFDSILSRKATQPFWLIDIPIEKREFYDKLSSNGRTLIDMDLIYPYGFGEALSGGEREYEYDKIISRMKFKGNNENSLKWYLDEVKKGIPPSAGCGIGVERLIRFICNLKSVSEARLFAKLPGTLSI
jgi:asparaginyl-tRNA synthetase